MISPAERAYIKLCAPHVELTSFNSKLQSQGLRMRRAGYLPETPQVRLIGGFAEMKVNHKLIKLRI